uniref:CD3e molecule, epsilon associated protein n=1 Tax=Mola mola TaxID=94237 RepID=A0A3Q3VUQ0_MOLML
LADPEPSSETTRYQCPADFVSVFHKPCRSTLTGSLKKNKKELWLIKAPADFNPEQWVQSYSFHLLSCNTGRSQAVFGPTFSGLLNVCESYGDSHGNLAPQVIPASPAPSIPPGLKQRFHPFGSKTPTLTCVAESETDGAALGPSSATFRPLGKRLVGETEQGEEDEEGRKKKKKKKKDKRIKTEQEEGSLDVVAVKVEPIAETLIEEMSLELPLQEGDVLEEKRKKKKKKKNREREEVEQGVSVKMEEEMVKCEPLGILCDDVVEGCVKKKKKKKNKTDDD